MDIQMPCVIAFQEPPLNETGGSIGTARSLKISKTINSDYP